MVCICRSVGFCLILINLRRPFFNFQHLTHLNGRVVPAIQPVRLSAKAVQNLEALLLEQRPFTEGMEVLVVAVEAEDERRGLDPFQRVGVDLG